MVRWTGDKTVEAAIHIQRAICFPTFGSHVALARPGAALSEGRLPRLAEDRPGRRLPGRSRGGQGSEDRGWGGDCCVTILTKDIYNFYNSTSNYLPVTSREEKCNLPRKL